MTRSNPWELLDEIVWAEERGGFDDEIGVALRDAYMVGASDPGMDQLIRSRQIEPVLRRDRLGTLEPFREPRLHRGNFAIGRSAKGRPIRMPLDDLTKGMLLAGTTGSGKTMLLIFLVLSILATRRIRIWLSDAYKKQLQALRTVTGRADTDLIILRPEAWRYNVLETGLSNPYAHASAVADLLIRTLGLPALAGDILRESIPSQYARFGILEGRRDAWPCLWDVYYKIERTPKLNAAARTAVLGRLGRFLTMLTPEVGAYRRAWRATDLAEHSIVFEMAGAPEQLRHILLESALQGVFSQEIERGVVNGPLSLLIAFDDSQRYFADAPGVGASLTPMEEIAGILRGTGLGLAVNVQTSLGLSRKLTANLNTRFLGYLGTHEDYTRLGGDMGLSREQITWAMHNLRPGRFIAQVASGHWRHPFILDVPMARIPDSVTDDDAAASVSALDYLPVRPAPEFSNWPGRPAELTTAPRQPVDDDHDVFSPKDTVLPSAKSEDSLLPKELLDYVETIALNPYWSTTERDQRLGLSAGKGDRFRKDLEARGLIERVPISPGGRGRRFLLLGLTREGRRLLKSLGVKISLGQGRGGLEHQYWVREIARWATSDLGVRCCIEDNSRGARVDLLVEFESEPALAVEVEISPGHEVENVLKDRRAGFVRIASLIKQPSRIPKVRREVEALGHESEGVPSRFELGRLTDFADILGRFATPGSS